MKKTILFLLLVAGLLAQTPPAPEPLASKTIVIAPETQPEINTLLADGWTAVQLLPITIMSASGDLSVGYAITLTPPPSDAQRAKELVAELMRRAELRAKREANQAAVPIK